jgi:hypothetical protein
MRFLTKMKAFHQEGKQGGGKTTTCINRHCIKIKGVFFYCQTACSVVGNNVAA